MNIEIGDEETLERENLAEEKGDHGKDQGFIKGGKGRFLRY